MSELEIVLLDPQSSMREICTIWPGESICRPGSIEETRTYIFELRNAHDPLGIHLFVDDQRLKRDILDDPVRVQWEWNVGFHAGEVEIQIQPGPHQPVIRRVLVTDPDKRKLNREQFDTMIRQILDDTFALLSLSSYKFSVARGSATHFPPIARLEFLQSRVESLESVIRAINNSPVRILRSTMESVPFHRVVSLTSHELIRSFAQGKVIQGPETLNDLSKAVRGYFPERIYKTQKTLGLDIREHRDIKAALKAWSVWLLSIADILRQGKKDEQELSFQRNKWAVRSHRMARRLESLLELPLFAGVQDIRQPVYATQIYQRIPIYGQFLALYNDFQKGIANIVGDFLQVPLARTYELYEVWAFLRLARAASAMYPDTNFNPDTLFAMNGQAISISPNQVCFNFGEQLKLCFQRTYQEFWVEKEGRGTYSRYMRPDFTIEIASGEDMHKTLIVLDAKYRVENGLNEALSSIHTYKDALVSIANGQRVEQVVAGAYLVTPDVYLTEGEWKDQRMPARLFHPEYRSQFRFGAVTMSPGIQDEEVISLVRSIISDCTG